MDEEKRENNLKRIEDFFNSDFNIKKILVDCVPNQFDKYDEQGKIDYYDKLYKSFQDIQFYFEKIAKNYFEVDRDLIHAKLNSIKEQAFSSSDLSKNYEKYFSNLDEKFIDDVKKECMGYYLWSNVTSVIKESTTVNELLHAMHSYIVNNENILQGLPIITQRYYEEPNIENKEGQEKENEVNFDREKVTLYGKENKLAKEIFDKYEIQPDFESADIISLENRLIMMIRGRGHALSIEIDTSDKKALVNYFIPKICNAEKVNLLRGVQKVDKNADVKDATTGMFETEKERLAGDIVDFISNVPTDNDIIWENNRSNEENIDSQVEQYTEEKIENSEETAIAIIPEKKNLFDWIKDKVNKIKEKFMKKDPLYSNYDTKDEENNNSNLKVQNFMDSITGNGKYRNPEVNKQIEISQKIINEDNIDMSKKTEIDEREN